ncbi:MAG TPA: response regulator transcription factor [Candidatus Nanopelagicales bacterium]
MTTQPDASPPVRVLVVDDEVPLAGVVGSYLVREGYAVSQAHDGPAAVAAARESVPDLIVLDVMLPGFDGIEVCRQVRTFSDAYIIMLTARDEEMDKVVALSTGADDYLVKPFSPRELIARVRAMLRRPRTDSTTTAQDSPPAEQLRFADVVLDPAARVVQRGAQRIELTRTEFDLLAALMAAPRAVLSRRALTDEVWGPDWYGDDQIVDVHIGHLRRKLGDDAASPRYVRTVRGVGYGMVLA